MFQIGLSVATFYFPDAIESGTGVEVFVSKLDDQHVCITFLWCSVLSWIKRKIPSEIEMYLELLGIKQ